MRISPINYKLKIRKYINRSLTFDFKIVISMIPVLFGIYKVFYLKYCGSVSDQSLLVDKSTLGQSFHNPSTNFLKKHHETTIMQPHYQNKTPTGEFSSIMTESRSQVPFVPSERSFLVHKTILLNSLKENLPGIGLDSTKISWQTVEQIFYDQLNFESLSSPIKKSSLFRYSPKQFNNSNINFPSDTCMKQVDVYNDSVKITTNSNWIKKQKKFYVGFVNNGTKSTKDNFRYQIGNNWSTLFAKKILNDGTVNNSYLTKKTGLLDTKNRSNTAKNTLNVQPKYFQNVSWKCETFLSLDELPLKLNSTHNENDKHKNTNLVYNALIPDDSLIDFKLKSTLYEKKVQFHTLNHKKTFLNLHKSFLPAKQLKPFIDASNFIPTKIYHFSKFFPTQNRINIKKTNENVHSFLKGVENMYLVDSEEDSLEDSEDSLEDSKVSPLQTDFFYKVFDAKHEKPICSSLKKNTKNNYLQHLIKQYSLNQELTPLANYGILNEISNILSFPENEIVDFEDYIKNPSINENVLTTNIQHKETCSDVIESLELLNLIEKSIHLAKNTEITPRIMSGYTIPDSSNHAYLFKLKKINKNPINFEILKNYSRSVEFVAFKLNIDKFPFKSKLVEYKPIYEGPCSFQDTNTNQLAIEKASQLKKQVNEFLYSDNPLTDRQQNFFGDFPISTNTHQINEVFIKSPLFTKKRHEKIFTAPLDRKSITRIGAKLIQIDRVKYAKNHNYVIGPNKIFSRKFSNYIIDVNQEEWNTVLNKFIGFKKNGKPNLKKLDGIINLCQPHDASILWPLSKLDYNETLPKPTLPVKFSFGKVYKKKYTVYKNEKLPTLTSTNNSITSIPGDTRKLNNFVELFYRPIEPITYDSWLFVTQFSIGFFLLNIFQNVGLKYYQEIKHIILSLIGNKDSKSSEENLDGNNQLDETKQQSNFKLIKNITKNFDNIAGMDGILPELGEIIWFLRNSGRYFKAGETVPRGILLTGPPGTGKTLLIQAIAGEAEVPVLIESGISLNRPGSSLTASEKLKNLFDKAQEIAPCIVFIDEIDTFGEARDKMMENPNSNNFIIDSIYPNNRKLQNNFTSLPNFNLSLNPKISNSTTQLQPFKDSATQLLSEKPEIQSKSRSTQEKSNLLMQFLVQLDGISTEKKILVFGATNRPQVLDSALTRPGRLNKTLNLGLPNKQKRVEIIKLYTKNIGIEKNISWEYLANLTIGLSGADLASAINHSSIQAIQAETIHTIETIEYGIECITGSSTQKSRLKLFPSFNSKMSLREKIQSKKGLVSDPNFKKFLFINRLAYYQAGKVVVQTLLKQHPAIISIRLWPELKNKRQQLMNGIIEKNFSQIYRRVELESRIIGFYAGKAGESLGLFTTISGKNKCTILTSHQLQQFLYTGQSDIAIQDISFASWLAELMVTKWYLYSEKISVQNFNQLEENSNIDKISHIATINFLEKKSIYNKNKTNKKKDLIHKNSQNWITKPWLQQQITKKLEFSYSNKSHWYKIYSANNEKNENMRSLRPDAYYHTNLHLNNLNHYNFKSTRILLKQKYKSFSEKQFSIINWNDIANLNRDYIYHNLILICFNKAISILDENRELVDLFATSLLQKEILREYEISSIVQVFYKSCFESEIFINSSTISAKKNSAPNKNIVLEKSWGKNSRKKLFRFINLTNLK